MKYFKLLIMLLPFYCLNPIKAQDSIPMLRHEIGFNTVSLIKQVISNSPSTTLPQLPYLVFYNLYYKDKVGFRAGLGIQNQKIETTIDGQPLPRTTTTNSLNLRLGLSYNFVQFKRLTFNVFGDVLIENIKQTSASTQTAQSFGNPVQTITSTSSDEINGTGAQIGVGVKFNIYKHLSLYAEVPISYIVETDKSSDLTVSPGSPTQSNSQKVKTTSTGITIPTTVYLVLRF